MRNGRALAHAVELARAPSLSSQLRRWPLPVDTLTLIKIASGCQASVAEAAQVMGLTPPLITEAARLYVSQVLLFPNADHHRVLGIRPGADRGLMRVHMRYLLLWLHPDHQRSAWHAQSAARVIEAWHALSPDRTPVSAARRGGASRARARYKPAWVPRPVPRAALVQISHPLRRWLFWTLVLASLVLPNPAFSEDGGRRPPYDRWSIPPRSGEGLRSEAAPPCDTASRPDRPGTASRWSTASRSTGPRFRACRSNRDVAAA